MRFRQLREATVVWFRVDVVRRPGRKSGPREGGKNAAAAAGVVTRVGSVRRTQRIVTHTGTNAPPKRSCANEGLPAAAVACL